MALEIWSVLTALMFSQASKVSSTVMSFPPKNPSLAVGLHSTVTADPRYTAWPDPSAVLYHLDSNYTSMERIIIQGAMIIISTDMTQCIQFVEYDPQRDAGKDFLFISKTLNDGTTPPTCVTFFGRVVRAAGRGQKMVIHNGPHGCMKSMREVMKVLVNALGLRNEYRRPDRDRFMQVNFQNMIPELRDTSLMKPYNESEVYYTTLFDYHSLTILPTTKYSAGNQTIFSFPNGISVPTMDYLSLNDCIGLSWMYGCDVRNCLDPYATGSVGPVVVTNVTVVTSAPAAVSSNPVAPTASSASAVTAARTAKSSDIGFVLLSPEQYSGNTNASGTTSNGTNTIFHVAGSNSANSSRALVFGKGQVPDISNGTQNAADGRVNISVSYASAQNGSSGGVKTFVLDKNMTLADIMASQTGPVTLHLENFSNATAYVGIYGPPGFTSNFITALNSTAIVFNGTVSSVANYTTSTGSTTPVRVESTSSSATTVSTTSTTTTTAAPATTAYLPPLPVLIP
ncbi:hypothetical protein RvY_07352 [Ramazzottius varieornatus]|uniref:Peptidase M12A domain-containing protein n=1 Tax=Ramazzottius varieornatus TaxID=947166 RepID=A0A1D1V7Z5_RAMVA|nr:hypothetical protein RvY_07352 [Ramazzottius varieornatus]